MPHRQTLCGHGWSGVTHWWIGRASARPCWRLRRSGGRDVKGYYKALGLRDKLGEATAEEIKSAYRKEAMAWHPDKHQGEHAKTRAAKAFRELQRAYQVLGNKVEREVYDSL